MLLSLGTTITSDHRSPQQQNPLIQAVKIQLVCSKQYLTCASLISDSGNARLSWALHHPNLVIIFLCAALFIPGLFSRDLWNPDEPRYAEVSREMYSTGNYLVPHLNGTLYAEKPPLFFWLTSGLYHVLGGPQVYAGRLISALAGLGVALLTYQLGREFSSSVVGLAGAVITVASLKFGWLAQCGVLDILLTFFIVLSIYSLYQSAHSDLRAKRLCWAGLTCAAMALGVLTKGPVGAILPLLVCVVMCALMKRWMPILYAVIGLLIAALVGVGWVYLAHFEAGEAFLQRMLFDQNIGRAVKSASHAQPWYHYLISFPGDFMPWSPLVISAIILTFRNWRREEIRGARLWLLWWAVIFVFFSLMTGKRERYLMPLIPAAGLLTAELLFGELRALVKSRRWIFLPAIISCVALVLIALPGSAIPLYIRRLAAYYIQRKPSKALGGAAVAQVFTIWRQIGTSLFCIGILAASVAAIVAVSRGRIARFFSLLVLCVVLLFGSYNTFICPAYNAAKSARPLAEAILETLKPDDRMVMYDGMYRGMYNYYLQRDSIPVAEQPEQLMAHYPDSGRLLVIAEIFDIPVLEKRTPLKCTILSQTQVGRKWMVLLYAVETPDLHE